MAATRFDFCPRTGAKIHFSNKNILGLGALQHFNHVCYADGTNDTLVILHGYAFFSFFLTPPSDFCPRTGAKIHFSNKNILGLGALQQCMLC